MENFFDKSLHFLGKNNSNVIALNIGSMDGVMFDEMIGYTNMYNFNVLYVEPIPYLFERLKDNIKNNATFENSAISDYNGVIEMITIDRKVIDSGLVHSCFYGMSAVYPPKNGLGSEFDRPTVEKYGEKITVDCITLDKLLRKHKIYNFDIIKIDAEGHDYIIFKQIDFEEFRPKAVRLEWINLTEDEQQNIINKFTEFNYKYEISGQDIVGIPIEFYKMLEVGSGESNEIESSNYTNMMINDKTTLVTGLWEIGREQLQDGWSRNFQHYLNKLEDLLKIDCNLIIFGDEELKKFVSERRSETNTQFVTRDLTWFVNNDFYHKIQKIRTNPNWYNQVGWLSESTQAKLEMYNPLVMSKMFLLHDAKILDKFNSDYIFWIDAGLSNTVHPGYFTHDNVLEKIQNLTDKFMFICFPYETNSEIHGFELNAINEYSKSRVDRVARAGFFGGKKDSVADINSIYYHLMKDTLDNGYMGTEESIFTIMTYLHPELIDTFFIDNNGLLGKFFEDVKNDVYTNNSKWNPDFFLSKIMDLQPKIEESNQEEVALYVIGFNSPNQFKTLIHSMLSYDKNFIEKPKKYLLDNSTDLSTTEQYVALCKSYGFEHIKKDNIGITGGRQWIAEHFDQSSHKYYFFFEDDMFFSDDKYGHCRNGFGRYVPNLYEKLMGLIKKENFDFIKMNYSEFFGDNGTQWAWYNVPQTFRQSQWPNNQNLPQQGLDPNSPKTKYDSIKSFEGLPYTTGEVFYCNWPQVMSKEGNRKCFINTKFASPYEQTLMSFIFQETVKNEIKPALLLLTPTEHNRFEHYEASLRKEC